jgi:hypothetical protein
MRAALRRDRAPREVKRREAAARPSGVRRLPPRSRGKHGRVAAACAALEMTKEEREIVEFLERSFGRALTPQEIYLSLQQARQIGTLDGEPDGPLPPLCGVVAAFRSGIIRGRSAPDI